MTSTTMQKTQNTETFGQSERITLDLDEAGINVWATKDDKKKRQFRLVFDLDSGNDTVFECAVGVLVMRQRTDLTIDRRKLQAAERIVKEMKRTIIPHPLLSRIRNLFSWRTIPPVVVSKLEFSKNRGPTVGTLTVTVPKVVNYDEVYQKVTRGHGRIWDSERSMSALEGPTEDDGRIIDECVEEHLRNPRLIRKPRGLE